MWIFCELWLNFFGVQEEVDVEQTEVVVKVIRPFIYFVAGGFGGVCSTIVGHPMDTVKTYLQAMPPTMPPMYSGTFDCFKKILKSEGIRGLYKGLGANITTAVPGNAVNFSGYGFGKSIQEAFGVTKFTGKNYFIAGAFSGIFTSVIFTPGERVKIVLQLTAIKSDTRMTFEERCGPKFSRTTIGVLRKLYRQGGLRNVFKGILPCMIRDVPGYASYFTTYELLRLQMLARTDDLALSSLKTSFAGGVAGIAFWLVAIPGDNVRTRLQLASEHQYPNGLKDVFLELYKKDKVISLYRGVMPVLLRAYPSTASCFIGFEYCKNLLNFYFE